MANQTLNGLPYNQNAVQCVKVDSAFTFEPAIRTAQVVAAGVTVTLSDAAHPAHVGERHWIQAAGGDVLVTGGTYPILGNGGIVSNGSGAYYELCVVPVTVLTPAGFAWIPLGAGGGFGIGEILVPKIIDVYNLPDVSLEDHIYARPVQSVDAPFELVKSSTLAADGITVVNVLSTGAGPSGVTVLPGRWLRRSIHVPAFTLQPNWWFDPLTGDNENDGSLAFPLQDLAEWCRRVVRLHITPNDVFYTLQLLNDIPATDVFRPTGEVDATDANQDVNSFVVKGTRTEASNTALGIGPTGGGSAVTVPGANTQALFDGGAGFVPANHIGEMVTITSGASAGAFAWITGDNGGTVAIVTNWSTLTSSALAPATTFFAAPIAGQTYILTSNMTSLAPEVLTQGTPILRYRFQDITLPPGIDGVEQFTMKSITGSFITSRILRQVNFPGSSGAFFSCFVGTTDATLMQFGAIAQAIVLFSNCGLRNVRGASCDTAILQLLDSHIIGGHLRTVSRTTALPSFGAAFAAAQQTGGHLVFRGAASGGFGPFGVGIFNAPSTTSAITVSRDGIATVLTPLYGTGAVAGSLRGVDVNEGATMEILSSIVPTITNTGGDLRLDNNSVQIPGSPQAGGGTLVNGESAPIIVPFGLSTQARIVVTMNDPGAGNLTNFAGFLVPPGTRIPGAGTFVVQGIDGTTSAKLATAQCSFDWAIVNQETALTSWATWAAAINAGGFGRNAIGASSSAKIISVVAPAA